MDNVIGALSSPKAFKRLSLFSRTMPFVLLGLILLASLINGVILNQAVNYR